MSSLLDRIISWLLEGPIWRALLFLVCVWIILICYLLRWLFGWGMGIDDA